MGSKPTRGGIGKQGAGGEAGGGRWAWLSTVLQRLLLIVLTDVPLWRSAKGRAVIGPSHPGEIVWYCERQWGGHDGAVTSVLHR